VSKEVLIVEDDRALAGMIARAIEAEGYPVRVVYDGQAAMEAIGESRPGVVLLDVLLPRMDGRAVLEALRSEETTRDLPVIIISGVLKGPSHAREFQRAGAQAFFLKPVARSQLLRSLRTLVGTPHAGEDALPERDRLSLAATTVAEVLWGSMKRRLTGALHLQSERSRKAILLVEGAARGVRSNVVEECLGQRLLAAGRIDLKQVEESLRRAEGGEARQGEILVEMGALTPEEIEDALRMQAEEKVLNLFSWSEGSVWFEPDTEALPLATSISDWPGEDLILRGVERMEPDRLERALASLRGKRLAMDPRRLPSSLRRLPGVEAVQAALQGSEGSAEAAIREDGATLYGLAVLGVVAHADGEPAAQNRPPEEASGTSGAGTGRATAEDLRAMAGTLAQKTHFEVLEVEQSASTSQIKSAFFKMAKRYHPDRYGGESEDQRTIASEIFARISTAHEVLSDPEQRREYLQSLRGETQDENAQEVTQILTAEMQFQKGEVHLKKKEYDQALECFRWAVELNPEEGEFQALYGWTLSLVNPEDEVARGEARQHLEKALDLAPRSVTGYYYMGLLLKGCGELDSAEKMFRKVVERKPEHVEANRELRLFTMRREKGGTETKSGLFGFGRKKS
jgi:CheY-like chemotaxis protein